MERTTSLWAVYGHFILVFVFLGVFFVVVLVLFYVFAFSWSEVLVRLRGFANIYTRKAALAAVQPSWDCFQDMPCPLIFMWPMTRQSQDQINCITKVLLLVLQRLRRSSGSIILRERLVVWHIFSSHKILLPRIPGRIMCGFCSYRNKNCLSVYVPVFVVADLCFCLCSHSPSHWQRRAGTRIPRWPCVCVYVFVSVWVPLCVCVCVCGCWSVFFFVFTLTLTLAEEGRDT